MNHLFPRRRPPPPSAITRAAGVLLRGITGGIALALVPQIASASAAPSPCPIAMQGHYLYMKPGLLYADFTDRVSYVPASSNLASYHYDLNKRTIIPCIAFGYLWQRDKLMLAAEVDCMQAGITATGTVNRGGVNSDTYRTAVTHRMRGGVSLRAGYLQCNNLACYAVIRRGEDIRKTDASRILISMPMFSVQKSKCNHWALGVGCAYPLYGSMMILETEALWHHMQPVRLRLPNTNLRTDTLKITGGCFTLGLHLRWQWHVF